MECNYQNLVLKLPLAAVTKGMFEAMKAKQVPEDTNIYPQVNFAHSSHRP
jgi:hypothetical protein